MTRLRPVLMTTAATVFGHMPLVFVTGAGAEARNSIGIMLVTGMTIGTLFTCSSCPRCTCCSLPITGPRKPDARTASSSRPPLSPACDDWLRPRHTNLR